MRTWRWRKSAKNATRQWYQSMNRSRASCAANGKSCPQRSHATMRFTTIFLPLIWKYTNVQELTPHILNELIEKIVVHEKEIGEGGVKTQQVDIYYKFIGCVNIRRAKADHAEIIKAEQGQADHRTA